MPIDEMYGEIREVFIAQCEPHQFEEPWDFLPSHDDVRCLPAEPASLMMELREAYSEDALIEAGVAEFGEDGSLRVRAKLNAPGEPVVVVRDHCTDSVVDMLTETGSVFEKELPIFSASVEKPLLLVPDRADCEVLLAFSLEDLAVLRVCGIAASLAAGVECLCPTDVDRLCEAFNLNRRQSARIEECQSVADEEAEEQSSGNVDPADWLARFRKMDCDARTRQIASNEDADDEEPLGKRLVLVAWSPATLDIRLPSGFDAVANHFKELEKYMGLDVSEVHVWKPTAEDLERLQFVMRYRDVGSAQGVLLDSLYDHVQSIERFGKDQPKRITVPADFPAAVVMLREALSANGSDCDKVQDQRDALQHVERLLHQQVVQPLMVEAMESRGASERALGLAAAHLIQMFLGQGVMINARIAKRITEKGLAGLDALPLEEIKGLLELADRVTKLFRELDRCRESTINVIQLSAVPQPKRLALPN